MTYCLLRLKNVVEATKRSKSTLYAEVAKGCFPRPIKVGRGAFWRTDEIQAMLNAYSAGATIDSLKALCARLHAGRDLLIA